VAALKATARRLRPGGRLWVNVPINSPAPDHIYLFRTPEEAVDAVQAAGFEVSETAFFPDDRAEPGAGAQAKAYDHHGHFR